MGQTHSEEPGARNHVTTEQLSHQLALRFAKKCFSPLEITHFKDVFRSLADDQDGIQYWKEETLCRFLALPDSLRVGALVFQMASYLGSFPFPSLAPSILTMEALLKVVVIMTERYGKFLKRGKADRQKLLFRSLAVFDRGLTSSYDQPRVEGQVAGQYEKPLSPVTASAETGSATLGFSVDHPGSDDDEDEDDDELALAALESLDAIEVFKHDHRTDTKIHHARVPSEGFQRLIMLLLVIAPLSPQEHLAQHAERLTETSVTDLRRVADCILSSFNPDEDIGISYPSYNLVVANSLPFMFDGLNPLFEHFLFSNNINLTRRKDPNSGFVMSPAVPPVPDAPMVPLLAQEGEILNLNILSQLSFFLKGDRIFRRLHPLYLGGQAGFSMGSFEHGVFYWRAPSILLIAGTRLSPTPQGSQQRAFADKLPPKRFADGALGKDSMDRVVYGAYLDVPWKHTNKATIGEAETFLFQLEPIHEVFRASTVSKDYAACNSAGISFGCPPLRSKAVSGLPSPFSLGAVSLMLDDSLEFGVFTHDVEGGGSFHASPIRKNSWQDRFEIESLEVWGCGGDEEAEKQQAAWAFESREAEARKNLKFGKDREADRAVLELAGLVGNHNASGGSMG